MPKLSPLAQAVQMAEANHTNAKHNLDRAKRELREAQARLTTAQDHFNAAHIALVQALNAKADAEGK